MANGQIVGGFYNFATNSFEYRVGPIINVQPTSTGAYIVTYEQLPLYRGNGGCKVLVNGVEAFAGTRGDCGGHSFGTNIGSAGNDRFNRINNQCTANPNGIYSSLADCQGGNGNCDPCPPCPPPPENYCPPGKTCIDDDEWGQIQSLTGAVVAKLCG